MTCRLNNTMHRNKISSSWSTSSNYSTDGLNCSSFFFIRSAENYKERGFTLIELLVVVAILSVLMGLVGPLALNSVERSKSKIEVMELRQWSAYLAHQAFFRQAKLRVEFKGKLASSYIADKFLAKKEFETIFFQPQQIIFTQSGTPSPIEIEYQINQQIYTVPLLKTAPHDK